MPQLMNQCDLIFSAEGIEGQLHVKATVLTDGNRLWACHGLAKAEDGIADGLLFPYRAARHNHRREAVLVGLGIPFSLVNIRTIALNALLQRFDFLRKLLQNLILQRIALAQMVGLEQLQTGHINVQIHLLLDVGIAGAQCLDFRIAQGGFVNVLRRAHRGFAGHDLPNKTQQPKPEAPAAFP